MGWVALYALAVPASAPIAPERGVKKRKSYQELILILSLYLLTGSPRNSDKPSPGPIANLLHEHIS